MNKLEILKQELNGEELEFLSDNMGNVFDAMNVFAIGFANWVGDRPLPEYSKSTNEWRWWNNKNKGYDYATTEQLLEMFTSGISEVV